MKIACFNSEYAIGNEYMLPAGPLRENLNEEKNKDIINLNGEKKNKKLIYFVLAKIETLRLPIVDVANFFCLINAPPTFF